MFRTLPSLLVPIRGSLSVEGLRVQGSRGMGYRDYLGSTPALTTIYGPNYGLLTCLPSFFYVTEWVYQDPKLGATSASPGFQR